MAEAHGAWLSLSWRRASLATRWARTQAVPWLRLLVERDLGDARLHLGAGHGELDALDDDPVGPGKAGTDDAQAADQRAGLDRLGGDRAVLADDQHDLARLVGPDRGVGDQQRRGRSAIGQAHVAEHAGRQEVVGVGDDRAGADRARILVDAVVGEVEPAAPVIVRPRPAAGSRRSAPASPLACRSRAVLRIERFRHVEGEIDRIERVDRGQQRSAAVACRDEIAGIDPAVGNAAADRRADLGELDVERARTDPGLRRGQRGAGRLGCGRQPVDIALRNRFFVEQPPGAAKVGFGQRQLALGGGDAGASFGQRRGERARVDGEEQLALADDLRRR